MNIKLSAESVSALYEFAKKTNYLYLNDILKNDFNEVSEDSPFSTSFSS